MVIPVKYDISIEAASLCCASAAVELEFLPGNPHLTSSGSSPVILTKTYTLEKLEGALGAAAAAEGDYPFAMRSSRVLSGPEWAAAAKDPTHRTLPGEQQQAKGGKGAKGKMACSFFHLFRQQGGKWVFNLTGDDRHAQVWNRMRGSWGKARGDMEKWYAEHWVKGTVGKGRLRRAFMPGFARMHPTIRAVVTIGYRQVACLLSWMCRCAQGSELWLGMRACRESCRRDVICLFARGSI